MRVSRTTRIWADALGTIESYSYLYNSICIPTLAYLDGAIWPCSQLRATECARNQGIFGTATVSAKPGSNYTIHNIPVFLQAY
jgi:hypothetical protein